MNRAILLAVFWGLTTALVVAQEPLASAVATPATNAPAPKPAIVLIIDPNARQSEVVKQVVEALEKAGIAKADSPDKVTPSGSAVHVALSMRADESYEKIKHLVEALQAAGVEQLSFQAGGVREAGKEAQNHIRLIAQPNSTTEELHRIEQAITASAKQSGLMFVVSTQIPGQENAPANDPSTTTAPAPVKHLEYTENRPDANSEPASVVSSVKVFTLRNCVPEDVVRLLKKQHGRSPSFLVFGFKDSQRVVVIGTPEEVASAEQTVNRRLELADQIQRRETTLNELRKSVEVNHPDLNQLKVELTNLAAEIEKLETVRNQYVPPQQLESIKSPPKPAPAAINEKDLTAGETGDFSVNVSLKEATPKDVAQALKLLFKNKTLIAAPDGLTSIRLVYPGITKAQAEMLNSVVLQLDSGLSQMSAVEAKFAQRMSPENSDSLKVQYSLAVIAALEIEGYLTKELKREFTLGVDVASNAILVDRRDNVTEEVRGALQKFEKYYGGQRYHPETASVPTPPDTSAQAPTAIATVKVFTLKYAQATDVAEVLKNLYDKGPAKIAADARTNSVIATGPEAQLEEIEALLLKLDEDGNSASSPAGGMRKYRVKVGDTLSGIALRELGSSQYSAIIEANRHVLKTPDSLKVGMELMIPTPMGSLEAEAAKLVVQLEDELAQLQQSVGANHPKVKELQGRIAAARQNVQAENVQPETASRLPGTPVTNVNPLGEIEQLDAEGEGLRERLEADKKNLERTQALMKKGVVSAQNAQEAEASVQVSEALLAAHQAQRSAVLQKFKAQLLKALDDALEYFQSSGQIEKAELQDAEKQIEAIITQVDTSPKQALTAANDLISQLDSELMKQLEKAIKSSPTDPQIGTWQTALRQAQRRARTRKLLPGSLPATETLFGKYDRAFQAQTEAGSRLPAVSPGNGNGTGATSGELQQQIAQLRKEYEAADSEARQLARQLQTTPDGGQKNEAQKADLRRAVQRAFTARQSLLRAELLEMHDKLLKTQRSIDLRERISDQIIQRRVDDLLNPQLEWEGKTPAGPPLSKAAEAKPRDLGQETELGHDPKSMILAKLQGIWNVEVQSEDVPKEKPPFKFIAEIRDHVMTCSVDPPQPDNDTPPVFLIKLGEPGTPQPVDLVMNPNGGKDREELQGIIEVGSDLVRICFNTVDSAKRPEVIVPGTDVCIYVLRRPAISATNESPSARMLSQLQGTWDAELQSASSGTDGGDQLQGVRTEVTVEGNLLKLWEIVPPQQGLTRETTRTEAGAMLLTLGAAGPLQHVDLVIGPNDGDKRRETQGIIEISGDTVRLCYDPHQTNGEVQRPVAFAVGGRADLMTLKRSRAVAEITELEGDWHLETLGEADQPPNNLTIRGDQYTVSSPSDSYTLKMSLTPETRTILVTSPSNPEVQTRSTYELEGDRLTTRSGHPPRVNVWRRGHLPFPKTLPPATKDQEARWRSAVVEILVSGKSDAPDPSPRKIGFGVIIAADGTMLSHMGGGWSNTIQDWPNLDAQFDDGSIVPLQVVDEGGSGFVVLRPKQSVNLNHHFPLSGTPTGIGDQVYVGQMVITSLEKNRYAMYATTVTLAQTDRRVATLAGLPVWQLTPPEQIPNSLCFPVLNHDGELLAITLADTGGLLLALPADKLKEIQPKTLGKLSILPANQTSAPEPAKGVHTPADSQTAMLAKLQGQWHLTIHPTSALGMGLFLKDSLEAEAVIEGQVMKVYYKKALVPDLLEDSRDPFLAYTVKITFGETGSPQPVDLLFGPNEEPVNRRLALGIAEFSDDVIRLCFDRATESESIRPEVFAVGAKGEIWELRREPPTGSRGYVLDRLQGVWQGTWKPDFTLPADVDVPTIDGIVHIQGSRMAVSWQPDEEIEVRLGATGPAPNPAQNIDLLFKDRKTKATNDLRGVVAVSGEEIILRLGDCNEEDRPKSIVGTKDEATFTLKLSKLPPGTFQDLGAQCELAGPLPQGAGQGKFRGGLRIAKVFAGTPAAEGGLATGDILVGFHVWQMTRLEELQYALAQKLKGEVSFHVIRSGVVRKGYVLLDGSRRPDTDAELSPDQLTSIPVEYDRGIAIPAAQLQKVIPNAQEQQQEKPGDSTPPTVEADPRDNAGSQDSRLSPFQGRWKVDFFASPNRAEQWERVEIKGSTLTCFGAIDEKSSFARVYRLTLGSPDDSRAVDLRETEGNQTWPGLIEKTRDGLALCLGLDGKRPAEFGDGDQRICLRLIPQPAEPEPSPAAADSKASSSDSEKQPSSQQ